MQINDIFESLDGIFPQEALALCKDGTAYIEELAPTTSEVERQELVAEAEYDEEGNEIKPAEYKTVMETVTVRRFQIVTVPEPTPEELAAQALAEAKATRAAAVAALTVEVDGMVFDGDETAQERMARTVTAATATGASMDDVTTWVLHDNTVAQVSIRQLATALRLAGEAQTALWTMPYEA